MSPAGELGTWPTTQARALTGPQSSTQSAEPPQPGLGSFKPTVATCPGSAAANLCSCEGHPWGRLLQSTSLCLVPDTCTHHPVPTPGPPPSWSHAPCFLVPVAISTTGPPAPRLPVWKPLYCLHSCSLPCPSPHPHCWVWSLIFCFLSLSKPRLHARGLRAE